MIDWWFASRFNSRLQAPFPEPWGEIDEAEARRRFEDPAGESFAIMMPRSDAELTNRGEGIVPFVFVIGSGPRPGVTIVQHRAPGLVVSEMWWRQSDHSDRLFCNMATIYEYPEIHPLLGAKTKPSFRAEVRNWEDGRGTILLSESASPTVTTGKRVIPDLEALYAPIPEWGHWDDLINAAPSVPTDPPTP